MLIIIIVYGQYSRARYPNLAITRYAMKFTWCVQMQFQNVHLGDEYKVARGCVLPDHSCLSLFSLNGIRGSKSMMNLLYCTCKDWTGTVCLYRDDYFFNCQKKLTGVSVGKKIRCELLQLSDYRVLLTSPKSVSGCRNGNVLRSVLIIVRDSQHK